MYCNALILRFIFFDKFLERHAHVDRLSSEEGFVPCNASISVISGCLILKNTFRQDLSSPLLFAEADQGLRRVRP